MAIILAVALPGAWWHINGGLVAVVVLVVVGGGTTSSSSRSNRLTVTNAYGNGNNRRGPKYLTLFLKPWGC